MKKGITISTLTITVTIMLILVSVSTVVGIGSIRTASYEEFLSKLTRVSTDVNLYVRKNNKLPIKNEIVAKDGFSDGLKELISVNGDENNELYVIDMEKLNTENVNLGYGTTENMDVFLVAKKTNNIYYLKGYNYKGETYHGHTGLVSVRTLGDFINSGKDYGKTVDYSVTVNGIIIDDWKVLYKQQINGEEYIYLITSERIELSALPAALEDTGATIEETKVVIGDVEKSLGSIYWASSPTGTTVRNPELWMANWGDYTNKMNTKSISYFLDETYWTAFKNDTDYQNPNNNSYVVGVIGTPTAEMFVASWNEKREATRKTDIYNKKLQLVKNGTNGYYINDVTNGEATEDALRQSINLNDTLYVWSTVKGTITWLASPAASSQVATMYINNNGTIYAGGYINGGMGVRPVVCIKGNALAKPGTTTDISLIKKQ